MAREYGQNSFLYGVNAPFLASMYNQYMADPNSVAQDWRNFFDALDEDEVKEILDFEQPQFTGASVDSVVSAELSNSIKHKSASDDASAVSTDQVKAALRALMIVRAHRVRGHLIANLDPLGIHEIEDHPELNPETYGFSEADYNNRIFLDGVLGFEWATLSEVMERLRSTYCGNVGIEFMHIQDADQKAWIQNKIEGTYPNLPTSNEKRQQILKDLARAETFEKYLNVKYPGAKRFGLDGGESLIPALEAALRVAAAHGTEEVVLGMAHRGRLSVLANIVAKPLRDIFAQFQGGVVVPDSVQGSGDVKYHLGSSTDREINGRNVHISLTANPSHLEAVNPVVLGKVRSKQDMLSDNDRSKVMGVLLHGDAAFAGQGLVNESLEMAGLHGYRTGGTLHVIINNQIGFTTPPPHSRSSPYSSDKAKSIQAPIFHVNADDPEAVVWVSELAEEFRQTFGHDVVVDMICYRRHGHNESDEPAFTNPLMYKAIAKHPTTLTIYKNKLENTGVMSGDDITAMIDECNENLKAEFLLSDDVTFDTADWLEGKWADIKASSDQVSDKAALDPKLCTGVDEKKLRKILDSIFSVPEGFSAHRKIMRQFDKKHKTIAETGGGVDWATGEALAFGALLLEGTPIRLSGQDSGRGTFSQRHAVLYDQENENKYLPLNDIDKNQSTIEIVDSPLSEASVLGFEYGYSLANPHALVMWEAQFGDFANGAQVIIDQFISSGELKWLRLCGVALLLPHGYEGQGPEHSSARLERFLQLCGQKNMRVVNCSTPANYFHVLRRQVRHQTRKPLVVMTPKSLLRHRLCVSDLKEFDQNSCFRSVIDDESVNKKKVRRVVISSGKVYYDLYQEREKLGLQDVALVRLEQFYPFPHDELVNILKNYKSADVIWCQEEPKNMGGWTFVDSRIEKALANAGCRQLRPRYVGRDAAAAPAVGALSLHVKNQELLVCNALTGAGEDKQKLSIV